MGKSIENRKHTRLRVKDFFVEYRLKGTDPAGEAEVIDLSTGGLCLLRSTPMTKGDMIQIRFPFQTRKLVLNAQVVRVDGREVGVQFHITPEEMEKLTNAFNQEYRAQKKKERLSAGHARPGDAGEIDYFDLFDLDKE